MDLDTLKQILNLVREHELSELEVEQDGLRLKIRKDSAVCAGRAAATAVAFRRVGVSAAADLAARSRPGRPENAESEIELAVVKSPIVGTFYRSPEPGAPAFVDVGTTVKKGQVLCIIEAMKLMNEIDSEYDGEIVNVYVESGQPVQYGERLFAIFVPSDVQKNPDRESRRNRHADHLRLPRDGHQDRRGVLRGRREFAARPLRRRGRLHRSGAQRRQLLERAGGDQRRRDHRCRCHSPGLRLSVRERLPR